MNHDFWNFSQSFVERSLSLLVKERFVMVDYRRVARKIHEEKDSRFLSMSDQESVDIFNKRQCSAFDVFR